MGYNWRYREPELWHILDLRETEPLFALLKSSIRIATLTEVTITASSVTHATDTGRQSAALLSSDRFWMLRSLFGPTERGEKKGQTATKRWSCSVFLRWKVTGCTTKKKI